MTERVCTLRLTARERDLVLKYGYPFPAEATLLRESPAQNGEHLVSVSPYCIERWVGDLVHSGRTLRSGRLLEELDALCSLLENAVARRPHTG